MTENLQIWTARVGYKAAHDHELVLDTTYKSATGHGKVFAPTREMVWDFKDRRITWDQYRKQYLKHLRQRYRQNKLAFEETCRAGELTLLCYCNTDSKKQCHRFLLAHVLENVADDLGIETQYMGERQKC